MDSTSSIRRGVQHRHSAALCRLRVPSSAAIKIKARMQPMSAAILSLLAQPHTETLGVAVAQPLTNILRNSMRMVCYV